MKRLESSVELSFVAKMVKMGVVTLKLNVTGKRGWPDRLVLVPGGEPIFIEFKRPGGRPRKMQEHIHQQLKRLDYEVQVHDDPEEAAAAVRHALVHGVRDRSR